MGDRTTAYHATLGVKLLPHLAEGAVIGFVLSISVKQPVGHLAHELVEPRPLGQAAGDPHAAPRSQRSQAGQRRVHHSLVLITPGP